MALEAFRSQTISLKVSRSSFEAGLDMLVAGLAIIFNMGSVSSLPRSDAGSEG